MSHARFSLTISSLFFLALLLLFIPPSFAARSPEGIGAATDEVSALSAARLQSPSGTISGTVTDQTTGDPLENIGVDVEQGGMGACTDAAGNYTLTVPLDTAYKITAGGSNFCAGGPQIYVREWWQEAATTDAATPILVDSTTSPVTGRNFTLEVGGSLSGTVVDSVTGDPIPSMVVNLDGGSFFTEVCTNSTGHYEFTGLPFNVTLTVSAGGSGNWCSSASYLREYWFEEENQNAADPIVLAPPVPPPTNINFTLDPGGTITGHVYESDGVTPITTSVWISAEPISGGDWVGAGSNPDGSFTMIGITPGTYRVRAEGAGYALEFYDEAGFDGSLATPVIVAAGAVVPDVDFTLDPGGTISGTVYAEDGITPLANMPVNTNEVWVGVCTDENGHYTLMHLPLNQPIRVAAARDSFNWCASQNQTHVVEWWQEAADVTSATPITLTLANRNPTGIDFTLTPGGTVSGIVTDAATGQPIGGMSVTAHFANDTIGVCTNPDGTYQLLGIPHNVQFRVSAGGGNWCSSKTYMQEFWQETPSWDAAVLLSVNSGAPNQTGINFTLTPAGLISGTVYAADGVTPLVNVGVGADSGSSGGGDPVVDRFCTNNDGTYSLLVPLGGTYKVFAGATFCPGPAQSFLLEWWQEAADPGSATPLPVNPATSPVTGINFTLDAGGAISGTVTAAEDGAPLPDIWVCAFDYGAAALNLVPHWFCAQTGPGGGYQITGLATDTYRVWLFPGDRLRLFYNQSPTFDGAAPVAVTTGTTTPDIDFSLPLAGVISGHITDENGQPLDGVTVSLADGTYPECSQPDGSYRIYVPAGSHVIKAEVGMCSDQAAFPTQYFNGVSAPADATPVNVLLGQTVSDIDFTLARSIAGSVMLQGHGTAPDPRWVMTLQVAITADGGAGAVIFSGPLNTDQNGHFVITTSDLPGFTPGLYRLRVKGEHSLANAVVVLLHYGANPVDLGMLIEGDANNNNGVNITDFSILAAAFATAEGLPGYDARADFTDDGIVNISDFSLLASSFTQSGAP
ncbi:MAG: carboxypeptidase regulatory-like domain-containing protein [Anaerolineae bacterium]|nr:carboxypeptidase regulatory-like domain-containing protein [Anaerolineae bacterium]